MSSNKSEIIDVQILTPLAVGDGGKLSPLADYFFSQGRLHLISSEKLEEWLWKHDKMEDYIEAVKASSRYAKDYFWSKSLGIGNLKSISNGNSYPLRGTENPIEVRTIVKNGNQPYLPGSSLKGAFKTALLHYWLTNQKKEALQTIIEAMLSGKVLTGNGDIVINTIKGFLSPDYGDKFPQDFHHLQVSDSDPLPHGRMEIVATKRLHLMKGSFDIPVVSEAIAPDDTLSSFFLKLKPDFLHPELRPLNEGGPGKLFEIINAFSRAHVGWLLDTLEEHENNIRDIDIFDDATNWLQNLYENIQNAPAGTAWMQIGFGKTWFANSCGLAIFDKSQEAFNALRRLYVISKSKSPLFPVTIPLGTHNYLPQGWVKMTIR